MDMATETATETVTDTATDTINHTIYNNYNTGTAHRPSQLNSINYVFSVKYIPKPNSCMHI